MNADLALKTLIEGNQRYVESIANGDEINIKINRTSPDEGQKPFAVILGCSDSRVPAELVFHQGLGDLFVIRVAGNIVAPSQIGSVEFACEHFGSQLVVVLGHTHCGAIAATVDSLLGDQNDLSSNVASIVDRVTPAVHPIVTGSEHEDKAGLLKRATRANVEQSVTGLEMRSRILRGLTKQNKLKIVGAEYSIETGEVNFFL